MICCDIPLWVPLAFLGLVVGIATGALLTSRDLRRRLKFYDKRWKEILQENIDLSVQADEARSRAAMVDARANKVNADLQASRALNAALEARFNRLNAAAAAQRDIEKGRRQQLLQRLRTLVMAMNTQDRRASEIKRQALFVEDTLKRCEEE